MFNAYNNTYSNDSVIIGVVISDVRLFSHGRQLILGIARGSAPDRHRFVKAPTLAAVELLPFKLEQKLLWLWYLRL